MLLRDQKQAVAQAWLDRRHAEAELSSIKQVCKVQCRSYFSRPGSLIWPFAAGLILTCFNRTAPQAIKATSLAVSVAQLVARAAPLARRFIR